MLFLDVVFFAIRTWMPPHGLLSLRQHVPKTDRGNQASTLKRIAPKQRTYRSHPPNRIFHSEKLCTTSVKLKIRLGMHMLVNTLAATVNQGMEPWEGFLYMTLELPFQLKYEH